MAVKNKINMRGSIAALQVGKSIAFLRDEYRQNVLRVTASNVGADLRRKFTVNMTEKTITVTRIA